MKNETIEFLKGLVSIKDLLRYPEKVKEEHKAEAEAVYEMLLNAQRLLDSLTSQDVKSAEDWLKKNCKLNDWDRLHENLKDCMLTNNVVEYMEQFASQPSDEWVKVEDRLPQISNNKLTTTKDVLAYYQGCVFMAEYEEFEGKSTWFDYINNCDVSKISYWRELPQPPK